MAVRASLEDVAVRYELTGAAPTADVPRIRHARRRADGRRVRIKVPTGDYPSAEDLAQIRHEYTLLGTLAEAPVAHALELVRVGNGIGLVLEDAAHLTEQPEQGITNS